MIVSITYLINLGYILVHVFDIKFQLNLFLPLFAIKFGSFLSGFILRGVSLVSIIRLREFTELTREDQQHVPT